MTLPILNHIAWKTVLCLFPVLISLFAGRSVVHYFQLESYQFPGYFHTLARNHKSAFLPGVIACGLSVIFQLLYGKIASSLQSTLLLILLSVCFLALSVLLGLLIAKLFRTDHEKKKFVFTARVKRLYVVHSVVMLLISILFLTYHLYAWWCVFLPFVLAFSGLLAWPIEKLISECYFRDARRKLLADPELIRIGITGSYGKTTVKHILGTILQEKYPTLITPASFNTPMGVTKCIRGQLLPSHKIFVGEMGARHVGDIKELCRLVKPTIGIITSVGPQHLETFKTTDRIAKTKYELIEALPEEDSHCYFFDDGSYCRRMYEQTTKTKTICGKDPSADCWYSDVEVSSAGSSFVIHFADGDQVRCHTQLLGEHNIHNVVLAASVAKDLGLTSRQIAHGIEKLVSVKARLELISRPGHFTIINDAFNSNPVGAKAALEVFKGFPKRRIIVTPGMVELGEKESEYNKEFGKQMAKCVDIAIIVGKDRTKPIIEGLLEADFPEESIFRVDSLDASTKLLSRMVRPEDTVLYENDLPDHYKEA